MFGSVHDESLSGHSQTVLESKNVPLYYALFSMSHESLQDAAV